MTFTACRVITCRGYATQTIDNEIFARKTRKLPRLAVDPVLEELRILHLQDHRNHT